MEISKEIFREYDIRGIYGEDLTDAGAYHIGRALGVLYVEKGATKICIGRDDRSSSAPLCESVIKGLVESGMTVTRVGIIPYPMTHFLTCSEDFDGGVNITASHNPKQYNGIKAEYKNAFPISGEEIQRLLEIIKTEKYVNGQGSVVDADFNDIYIKNLSSRFNFRNKHKVLLASGNGATSEDNPKIFKKLGVETVDLDCFFDSTFPYGISNPEEPAQIKRVAAEVQKSGVEVGFMFDGDGDRLGVIDENGTYYPTDRIVLLLIKDLLSRVPGARVLYDVKSSELVGEIVTKFGGVSQIMQTGRTHFLIEVMTGDAVLGAEFSGHIYIKDNYFGYDDAAFAACDILRIMDASGKKLSELMAQFPTRSSTPEIQVPCSDDTKFDVIKDIQKRVLAEAPEKKYKKVVTLDGVRVSISESAWFLIRAKNTSPFLTVRAEGSSDAEVHMLLSEVSRLLSAYKDIDLSLLK